MLAKCTRPGHVCRNTKVLLSHYRYSGAGNTWLYWQENWKTDFYYSHGMGITFYIVAGYLAASICIYSYILPHPSADKPAVGNVTT